ncbi:MAG: hypothetical protein M3Y54_18290 [Bacteroidota bacterium]|nr:hypothetical protein [Bacteroidota bacterium]
MPFFIRHSPGAKPVEATQWFPGHELPGVSSESAGHPGGGGLLPIPPHAYVHTRKGILTVFAGDWVITEPDGTLHVCQQRLFELSYAPVAEAGAEAAPAETEA